MIFREASDKRQNRNEKLILFSSGGWLPATGLGEWKGGCQRELNSSFHCFDVNIHIYVSGYGKRGTDISCNNSKPRWVLDMGQDQLPVLLWGLQCFLCPLAGAQALPGHGALPSCSFPAEMVRIGFESKGCVCLLRHGMPALWQ